MSAPSHWHRDLADLKDWWRHSTPDSMYLGIGGLVGGLGAIATFLIVLLAAVDSVGWVIGLVFGWIIGLVAGAIVFWVGRYVWPFVLILAIYVAHHWQIL
jgi:hypothetical protein